MMKKVKKVLTLMVLGSLLPTLMLCSSDDEGTMNTNNPPSSSKNKIMPLGASRVAGARPEYESYRYELWKLLVENDVEFDFVGTETDNAIYPDFNGQSFDRDHEGRGGISSGGILAEIDLWLNDLGTAPDIVLFSSPGGNDGIDQLQQSVSNINAIIDILQAANPNVIVYLELPAPPLVSEQTTEFVAYYNNALQLLATVAEEQTSTTSQVLTIDMSTGFNDSFLADDVHYNEAGAQFIANRYFETLQNILN